MTKYYGRFKHGQKWSTVWHVIPSAHSRDEALGKFIKGTRFLPSQIQITTKNPAKDGFTVAGR